MLQSGNNRGAGIAIRFLLVATSGKPASGGTICTHNGGTSHQLRHAFLTTARINFVEGICLHPLARILPSIVPGIG